MTLASKVLGTTKTVTKVASAQTGGVLNTSAGVHFTMQDPGFPSTQWPGSSETFFTGPLDPVKELENLWGNELTNASIIEQLIIEYAEYQYKQISRSREPAGKIRAELQNLYCNTKKALDFAGDFGPHDEKLTRNEILQEVPMFDSPKKMYVNTADYGGLIIRKEPIVARDTLATRERLLYGEMVEVHGFYVDPIGITWAIIDFVYEDEDNEEGDHEKKPEKMLVQAQHLTGDKDKLDLDDAYGP